MKGSSFEYMTRILFFGLLFFSFSCFPFLVILFIPLMTYTKQLWSKNYNWRSLPAPLALAERFVRALGIFR